MIRSGQIYRGVNRTTGRYRYVRVERVYAAGHAIAREVTKNGRPVRGRSSSGLRRADPIRLTISGGALVGLTLAR